MTWGDASREWRIMLLHQLIPCALISRSQNKHFLTSQALKWNDQAWDPQHNWKSVFQKHFKSIQIINIFNILNWTQKELLHSPWAWQFNSLWFSKTSIPPPADGGARCWSKKLMLQSYFNIEQNMVLTLKMYV